MSKATVLCLVLLFGMYEHATTLVISLDCNDELCPSMTATFTCQVDTTASVRWTYSPPPDTLIGAVSGGTTTLVTDGYNATYIGNGVTTLVFNATSDRNATVVQCQDNSDGDAKSCTVNIAS